MFELEIFAVAILAVALIGKIPYLNIVITKQISLLLLIVFGAYLFQIKKQVLLTFSLLLFACALVLSLAGKMDSAESIGTIIYALLWFVAMLYVKDIWRQI
ncbi:MAG: hypothetical protein AAB960_00260 [Patescibacteria group bacterium]